jgi:hypothetical protein
MMVDLPSEWTDDDCLLVYDDGNRIMVAGAGGNLKTLAEGRRPRWQP